MDGQMEPELQAPGDLLNRIDGALSTLAKCLERAAARPHEGHRERLEELAAAPAPADGPWMPLNPIAHWRWES